MVRALGDAGARVHRLLRPGAAAGPDDLTCELTDAPALASAMAGRGIDSVFHFAAQSMPEAATADPAGTFAVNVDGTVAVLEACRRTPGIARIVVASSCRVYGPADAPCDEDAPLAGSTVYDCSKIAAEAVCRAYHRNFALPLAIMRCGNLFGPGDPQRERIVPATIDALLAGERPVILSDGTAERDYLHVADAVAACLRLAEEIARPDIAGQAFNIAGGRSLSVLELVRILTDAAGQPGLEPEVRGARSEAVSRMTLATGRAHELLGWAPAAPLEQRLAETFAAECARHSGTPGETPAPRIFIGIPTVNRPDLVRETIASIMAQSFTDFRVVVSDNASPPAIAADVAAFVSGLGDARIRFVGQPVNAGEYGQGRYLFAEAEKAGADYFMILHDDDLAAPDYLERALGALDARPEVGLFIANPQLMDRNGQPNDVWTRTYLDHHGRSRHPGGIFDVLDQHMAHGFTPISGTVFRTSAIREAGLTDPDCTGNYPFECNVVLRLGDRGVKGWFCPEPLLLLRYHEDSLRVYARLLDNPVMVEMTRRLFERRRYRGRNELRRRVLVSRFRRADAMLRLREGNLAGCRAELAGACAANPLSPRAWGCRILAWLAPARLRAGLAEVTPRFSPEAPTMAAA